MLRRRLLTLQAAGLPRFYTQQASRDTQLVPRETQPAARDAQPAARDTQAASRDARLLALAASHRPRAARVSDALAQNFYALAALLVAQKPPPEPREGLRRALVRGLCAYDPRLLPVNVRALHLLQRTMGLDMDSAEKAVFVDSLIAYGDPELVRSGLLLLRRAAGGPVPVSALMALAAHAKATDAPATLVYLWYYLRETYPRTLFQYSALIVDFLETFSRKKRLRPLALEVAQACLGGDELNPSIALAVAKTSYMLKDDALAARLCTRLGAAASQASSVLAQLDAAQGRAPRRAPAQLPAQEMAGVVKGAARRDVARGEELAAAAAAQTSHTPHRQRLVTAALCNQYIHTGDFAKFMAAFRELQALRLGSGVLLNLRLTWELHHGSFAAAKRHYQNWDYVPLKQRAVALRALEALAAQDERAQQWTRAEKSRHGLPL